MNGISASHVLILLLIWADFGSCTDSKKAHILRTPVRNDTSSTQPFPDKRGDTELHIAAQSGNVARVKFLLSHGAAINAVNNNHETPLFAAIISQDISKKYPKQFAIDPNDTLAIATLLLDHGANVNTEDNVGRSALVEAAGFDEIAMMRLLLARGALVNDGATWGALVEATSNGYSNAVKLLLENGANPNGTRGVNLPLCMAARSSNGDSVKIVNLLLDAGADVNGTDGAGESALYVAGNGKNWKLARFLVERGADVNIETSGGRTPLHTAAYYHEVVMVKVLLKHGARADAKDTLGNTPVDLANKGGVSADKKAETLKLLEGAMERPRIDRID